MTALVAPGRAREARHGLIDRLLASPFYGITLSGQPPRELRHVPRDAWPGHSARGERLLREEAALMAGLRRGARYDDPVWLAWLHGFGWLRDLRAFGGDEARRLARELVATWILEHERWSGLAWRPDVLGARVAAWLGNHDFFAASADDFLRREIRQSIARQARHLARSIRRSPPGAARIAALHGLVAAGGALPDGDPRLLQGLKLLLRELPWQIGADGGHVERSPAAQLDTLRRLVEIRAMLRVARIEPPDALQAAIERMAPMLRFFRHGDGGLALFNGSMEEQGWAVDLVLTQADAKGRPDASAPETGFQRLLANRTLVILDAGPPPPAGLDGRAHAGTLGFEMSVGKERLIVNCGVHAGPSAAWRLAARATAAHSTVCVAETDSSELLPDGGLGRRPGEVAVERHEDAGHLWVEASHDGYREPFGLMHTRRLYLAGGGDDLRGADTLAGGAGKPFAIRFHLHPRVTALLEGDGSARLRLPGGACWRMRAAGGRLSLGESVYLGADGAVTGSVQLVVEGVVGTGGAQVKWALQALPKT